MKKLIGLISIMLLGSIPLMGEGVMAGLNIQGTSLTGTLCKCGTLFCPPLPNCSLTAIDGTKRFFADIPDFGRTTTVAALDDGEISNNVTENFGDGDDSSVSSITSNQKVVKMLVALPSREATTSRLAQSYSQGPIVLAKKTNFVPYDLLCQAKGAGAGNVTLNPTAEVCNLRVTAVTAICANPAGGLGGDGVPFGTNVNLEGTDQLDQDQVFRNGRWESSSLFTQAQLINALGDLSSLCVGPGNQVWTFAGVIVNQLEMTNKIYRCGDSACTALIEPPEDTVRENCVSTDGANFACNEIF